ncbi:MAG: aminotransferase class I/II-fold pyridoxal phosphate-dependent enzyme [Catenulispora sp.]
MKMSERGRKMTGLSGIRSIMEDIALAGAAGGEWFNLSPGNPARVPEAVATWRRLYRDAAEAPAFAETAGRYGPSRGADVLVEEIVRYFRGRYGWAIDASNVVVGPGAQMLAFAAATLFTGPTPLGHRRLLLPSLPDYTGYQGIPLEQEGIAGVAPQVEVEGPRRFRYRLDLGAVRAHRDVGMMLVSSPANPTGRALTEVETAGLAGVAEDLGIPLVLDHAYGQPFPAIAEDPLEPEPHPNVIHLFTFSKAGLPGERLGFAVGAPEPVSAMVAFLANVCLHAPQTVQAVAARALADGEIDLLSEKVLKPHYLAKREAAERALDELLPRDVRWRLHSGAGGMFCWLWIDEPWFDDLAAYEAAKRRRLFLVPGRHFFALPPGSAFAAGHGTRCLRLSLSAPEPEIIEGIRCVADVLRELRRA